MKDIITIQEVWKNIYLWIHSNINISTVNQIFPVRLEDVTNNSAKREGRNRFLQLSSWFLIFCKLISVYCGQSLCQNTSFPWISLWFDGFWSLSHWPDSIFRFHSLDISLSQLSLCNCETFVSTVRALWRVCDGIKELNPNIVLCYHSIVMLKPFRNRLASAGGEIKTLAPWKMQIRNLYFE